MYIESYEIISRGTEWAGKNGNTEKKNQVLTRMTSKDGMNSKAFIDLVEQIGDSHDARCDVHFTVVMKQHRY